MELNMIFKAPNMTADIASGDIVQIHTARNVVVNEIAPGQLDQIERKLDRLIRLLPEKGKTGKV